MTVAMAFKIHLFNPVCRGGTSDRVPRTLAAMHYMLLPKHISDGVLAKEMEWCFGEHGA
jgi:hypothetical protein